MKIATWNLGRPGRSGARNALLVEALLRVDADILILTETNEAIHPGDAYTRFGSAPLSDHYYLEGERRTEIYCKYPAKKHIDTFNKETNLCIETLTPLGELVIYGTVIGSHGNRNSSFNEDLGRHLSDFQRMGLNGNSCISGDFNISFCNNYYEPNYGRERLQKLFDEYHLVNLTADIPGNVNHIVLSQDYVGGRVYHVDTWNHDRRLSDHCGLLVTI